MKQPTVVCVMLANGRNTMVERALSSFRAQTYKGKRLLIWDTTQALDRYHGQLPVFVRSCLRPDNESLTEDVPGFSIGQLRNRAVERACSRACSYGNPDIICHWDSDDWSHPERIAEQVAFLQLSGKDCVGYNSMLFWDTTPGQFAAAWEYDSHTPPYCMGTSMMYWRKAWEARPFPDLAKGEDTVWQAGIRRAAVSAIHPEPRMIASIHGGNVSSRIVHPEPPKPGRPPRVDCWRRVPEWDNFCARIMNL
jgi:glycosyltransferase involved in cell wall biosynthesis